MGFGDYFDIAVCTIFAREVLEATIVIGQYRTVLLRSPEWQEPEKQKEGLKAITSSAIIAALVALVILIAVAVTLYLLAKDSLSPKVIQITEGISKLVAAVCIAELSLKIPKWLGLYARKKKADLEGGLSVRSIKFNVAWNIWREVAETGAFLLPSLLRKEFLPIPVSGAIGIFIGGALGAGIYISNKKQSNMKFLAIFMSFLMAMLSIGLFTGGCNELEKAFGATKTVWTIEGDFWDNNKLPMTIIKPFGYSSSRTVLQICAFWCWSALLVGLHYWKYQQSSMLMSEDEEGTEEDNLEAGNSDVSGNPPPPAAAEAGDKFSES